METRKFVDIEDANRLGVYDYSLLLIDSSDSEALVISGDRGYPDYLRIDIKFIGHEYLACATSFYGTVRWRMATQEEAEGVRRTYSERDFINVYCIEENFAAFSPRPSREPQKFFIAAERVEIQVSYGGKNIDELLQLK